MFPAIYSWFYLLDFIDFILHDRQLKYLILKKPRLHVSSIYIQFNSISTIFSSGCLVLPSFTFMLGASINFMKSRISPSVWHSWQHWSNYNLTYSLICKRRSCVLNCWDRVKCEFEPASCTHVLLNIFCMRRLKQTSSKFLYKGLPHISIQLRIFETIVREILNYYLT